MAEETTAPVPAPEAPNIPIDDLDTFVRCLVGWHTNQVGTLRHFLEVPEGSKFTVGEKELVLNAEVLDGFRLGIEIALMQLGTLPFEYETEDEY
jgi:hypothetical protein